MQTRHHASPPGDSSSPTFCSSLDPCSSHGFSSLQSPSALLSFFSNDCSQQIKSFQPLSLDSAELCCCRLRHCRGVAALDITQDDSVSQSSLNILTSEEGPFNISTSVKEPLLHHKSSQKLLCPFHTSPNTTQSQNCEALQKDLGLDCIPTESLPQKNSYAEHSISLSSSPSSLQDESESSAFLPIQDGYNEKEPPAFSELNSCFCSSSPDPREHSPLLLMNDSKDVYSNSGYAFHSQIAKTPQFESFETHGQINDTACIEAHNTHWCHKSSRIMPPEVVSSALTSPQFESFETHGQINDTACIEAHNTHRCYKSSCIMPPEVVSSALTSTIHSFVTAITRHGDVDDKETFTEAHINCSGKRRVRLLDNLTPPCSVESKLTGIREVKEALQEVHENKKSMHSSCKDMFINMNALDDEASKENIGPHVCKQAHKRVGEIKTDSGGWMCPKDAKKNFKPKPRQLLLDKWLARQR